MTGVCHDVLRTEINKITFVKCHISDWCACAYAGVHMHTLGLEYQKFKNTKNNKLKSKSHKVRPMFKINKTYV